MYLFQSLFFIVTVFFALIVNATVMGSASIEELYRQADTVALVQVIEGKVIYPLDDECGSKYKGYVIKGFKGDALQNIEFGHFDGLLIGSRYLVFLTKPSTKYRTLNSTNSVSIGIEQRISQKCTKEQTGMNVMQGVHGAMLVEQPQYGPWAVKVPTRFIEIPGTFRGTPIPASTPDDFYTEPVWILEPEMFKLLESYSHIP